MCDLVTGEERKIMHENGNPADHVACTVEMTSINTPCETMSITIVRAQLGPESWTQKCINFRRSCSHRRDTIVEGPEQRVGVD